MFGSAQQAIIKLRRQPPEVQFLPDEDQLLTAIVCL
jgi:hypothetical protein